MTQSTSQPSRPSITVRELIADSSLGLEMQVIAGEEMRANSRAWLQIDVVPVEFGRTCNSRLAPDRP